MDAAGAERLRSRIEQQQHWRLAEAVCDGRQPAVDPDSNDLEHVGDGIRLYKPRLMHGTQVHICKRLVDGVWEHGSLEHPNDGPDETAPREPMADVA